MFEYPKWKLGLVVVLIVLAGLYALPNAFPDEPAIQISASRGSTVDAVLQGRVEGTLKGNDIPYFGLVRTDDRLMVRFADADLQLKASSALKEDLGQKFIVALNLASTVPNWLSTIHARPVTKGLDLQGGVHFLMEVDQQAARTKLEERYVGELYQILRTAKIAYRSVNANRDGLSIELITNADRERAVTELADQSPDLIIEEAVSSDTLLLARIKPEKIAEAQKHTIEQNITTLRNRISELKVSEPIVAQQGQTRIVVQLPGVQDTTVAKKILGATATLEYRAVNDTRQCRGSRFQRTRAARFQALLRDQRTAGAAEEGCHRHWRPVGWRHQWLRPAERYADGLGHLGLGRGTAHAGLHQRECRPADGGGLH